MKLSFKTILPILLIFTLLILLAGCTTPSEEQPGYTQCINTAPKVDPIPRQAISAEGVSCIPTYEFTVSNYAWDDEGNNLTYSFVDSVPTGMKIDAISGKISGWVPKCCSTERCHQCCEECVTVRVQDNGCYQPLSTDVNICVEVWNGTIDGGSFVGIGFDNCPISCP